MQCKHRHCNRKPFRRGICVSHYRRLANFQPAIQREKPLTKKEMEAIDLDDFWEWVKIELRLESNKKITTEKTAHKH